MAGNKGLKIFGIIVGAFVVVIIAAVVTVGLMFPPSRIKAMVLPEVEKALGREVKVEKVGLSFFPILGVKMQEFEIANTARPGFTDKPFVMFESLIVQVKIIALLQKKLEVAKVTLKKPAFIIETDPRGSFNYEDLTILQADSAKPGKQQEQKGGGLPVPLTLEQFNMVDGVIIYHDRKGGRRTRIGDVDITIGFSIDKELRDITTQGNFAFSDVSLQTKDVPTPLSGLTITLKHDLNVNAVDGRLKINEVRASLQKIYVKVTGEVSDFNKTPQLDLAITTDKIMFADLIREIPPEMVREATKLTAEGYAQVEANVKGPVGGKKPLGITGFARVRDVMIKYADLPKAIRDFNADIAFTPDDINIKKLGMNFGGNPISVQGSVAHFAMPTIDLTANAKVNLGDVRDIVKLEEGNSLDGLVTANISAKGVADPRDVSKIDVTGNVKLDNIIVTTPAVTQPVKIDGSIDLTSQKISDRLNVALGKTSRIIFTSTLTDYLTLVLGDTTKSHPRPKLTFSINSPVLNTNEFLPAKEPAEQKPAQASPAAAAPAALLLAEPLPDVDVQGTIDNDNLVYEDITLSGVKAQFAVDNDIIDVKLHAGAFGGTFAHDLRANAKNHANLDVKSDLDIRNLEVGELLVLLEGMMPDDNALFRELRKIDESMSGKASFNSDFITSGGDTDELTNNLNGTFRADFRDGRISKGSILKGVTTAVDKFYKIDDVSFRDMWIAGKIKDGKMIIEDLNITSRIGDWAGEGTIAFDTKLDLTLKDKLTAQLSKPILSVQNKGKDAVKNLLKGTAFSGASGLVDQGGIPHDQDGRVTLLLGLGGTITSPTVSFKGFGKEGATTTTRPSPTQEIRHQVQQKVDEAKQKLEAEKKRLEAKARKKAEEQKNRAREEARKREAEAKAKAEAEKKRLEEEARKKADDAKKKAKDKLKKLF
ncbi:MAG: AsmA family protein [Chitinivibrionales bacterium]|nr:AsmA family protein [Chitinivibrionales bacterium]